MGARLSYHLTILRSAQGRQIAISLEEARGSAPDWDFTDSPPTFAQGEFCLYYQDGELWGTPADDAQVGQMIKLASRLGARVRGDEFETYATPDKHFFHPDDRNLRKAAESQSRALLAAELAQQKRIRNYIVGFFLVLGTLGYFIGKTFE